MRTIQVIIDEKDFERLQQIHAVMKERGMTFDMDTVAGIALWRGLEVMEQTYLEGNDENNELPVHQPDFSKTLKRKPQLSGRE